MNACSAAERRALLLALGLLTLLTGVALYARPLTPIDETRYISVAWEMWLRGDPLVPFKNGAPYSHKPPLIVRNMATAKTNIPRLGMIAFNPIPGRTR